MSSPLSSFFLVRTLLILSFKLLCPESLSGWDRQSKADITLGALWISQFPFSHPGHVVYQSPIPFSRRKLNYRHSQALCSKKALFMSLCLAQPSRERLNCVWKPYKLNSNWGIKAPALIFLGPVVFPSPASCSLLYRLDWSLQWDLCQRHQAGCYSCLCLPPFRRIESSACVYLSLKYMWGSRALISAFISLSCNAGLCPQPLDTFVRYFTFLLPGSPAPPTTPTHMPHLAWFSLISVLRLRLHWLRCSLVQWLFIHSFNFSFISALLQSFTHLFSPFLIINSQSQSRLNVQ